MKRLVLVMAFLVLATSSFAQQSRFRKPTQKEIHLQKAQNKSSMGWVLIGVGGVLMLGSMIVGVAHGPSGKDQPSGLEIPLTIGAVAFVGGVALKIAAIRHEKKALETSASFNFQPLPELNQSAANLNYYPAITLKVKGF